VPAVDFRQNTEGRGLYEGVLSLIEQYNAVLSEKANDVEYFSDCYMVVKGKELDESEIENIRENKIINLFGESTEGLDVMFLVKPTPTACRKTSSTAWKRSSTRLHVPDITDDNFATASGIALKMRMMPMSNLARNKELKFRRGVQERMRLLAAYPNADFAGDDWQAVEVTMHRNMPDDLQSEASVPGSSLASCPRRPSFPCSRA
jgi:SPP1 family phage portal protein